MGEAWISSAAARRVLVHWADPRPAWLWNADGTRLLWRNGAARFFNAKLKKSGLRIGAEPAPIKGQIARLIRLGSLGRSSLSRIQMLAGGKALSTTASATPLEGPAGEPVALIVGVDPIEADLLALPEAHEREAVAAALFPPGSEYLLIGADGAIDGGSERGLADYAETIASQGLPEGDAATIEIGEAAVTFTRFTASPEGHQLLLIEGEHSVRPAEARDSIDAIRAEEGLTALEPAPDAAAPEEPELPMGLPPAAAAAFPLPELPDVQAGTLSSLFDRLADQDSLYGELSAADEHYVPPPERVEPTLPFDAPPPADAGPVPEAISAAPARETDVIAAVIAFEDDLHADPHTLYRVTGRGFTPAEDRMPEPPAALLPEPPTLDAPAEIRDPGPDVEAVERTSRYNFDELSRILADRVGADPSPAAAVVEMDTPIEPSRSTSERSLINVAAETFILNRLPLGIMVFRDQQVLFANRALTDLVGYETIDSLKAAGLTAIFPADDTGSAGPVTELVRLDGTKFPVTARLQSITWHGRPALMLSASPAERRVGHEGAVRAFAETLAGVHEHGFVAADRAGKLTQLSTDARLGLEQSEADAIGRPLSALIHADDHAALRDFLERPARFAETARPGIVLRGSRAGTEVTLFAEGQAGIVTGYFGFVRLPPAVPGPVAISRQPPPAVSEDRGDSAIDPSVLARVSRGVRRPLNTIIGFADLIRSTAFGTIENHRYVEYARDIRTAGQEIAVLVDELDDYARLKNGNYTTRPADLDLGRLLESCAVRVRGQASAARVLVRSAISERLPRVHADRASFGQAILNLLASAIDQTPPGGSVILSAQPEEDGSIAVNIRDSGLATADLGERFVVFRDGVGKDGEALAPIRSSVGLALTRSLIAVNNCRLGVSPAGAVGTLFSLTVPPDLVAEVRTA